HLAGGEALDLAGGEGVVDGLVDGLGDLGLAKSVHHHATGADGGERVDDVHYRVLRSAAAHGLEHRDAFGIDVAAGGDAEAALNDGGKVGDDVAEEILGDDHVVVLGLLDEPHGAGVDVVIVLLDLGIEFVAEFLVHADPQIAGVGEHVALVHEGQHLLLAVALAGQLVGVLHTALDDGPRVGHHLDGGLQRGALVGDAADAGVDAAGVFAHDH